MKQGTVNIFLLFALAIVVGLTFAVQRDSSERNFEVIPEMFYSVPYDAFAPNPLFPDGKTLRSPVVGTIPREIMPVNYGASPEEAARAGVELDNPFTVEDGKSIERASVVYARFCQPCHGGRGAGDGIVTQYGFPPPPSLSAENALRMRDGQIFHVISYGQGNMPALASQISRDDRWKVILMVRSLQQQQKAVAPVSANGRVKTSTPVQH